MKMIQKVIIDSVYIEEGGWIHWFCILEGNDFFVEIDEDLKKIKQI